jgi:glycosyltransferase involved in cell wall biosynthesis
MKLIYALDRPHTLQKSLIEIPPKGYKFTKSWQELAPPKTKSVYQKIKNKLSYNPFLKNIWEFSKKFRNPVLNEYNSMIGFDENPEIQKADIIFSGRLLPAKKPYWLDLEHIRQLMGWDINLLFKNADWISQQLAKPECRLITGYTKAGINSVIDNLPNSDKFKSKCHYLYNAVPSVKLKKNYNKENLTLLFIGSAALPYDFYMKGGNLALEAFDRLSKKYSNLKLIVKPWAPLNVKLKYQNSKNIEFQGFSSDKELDVIFKETDILVSPTHNTLGRLPLDAMNYGIPVVTTDLWANSEMIKNNYNGLLIPVSEKVHYLVGKNIPNSRSKDYNCEIKQLDEKMVKNLMAALEKLITSPKLRERLGRNGKKEIENGKFSIKSRNNKLKKLLDAYF